MSVNAVKAATYLKEYIEKYCAEYQRFTAPPTRGAGFPPLRISPYLYSTELACYLAQDGAVVADMSWQPPEGWESGTGLAVIKVFRGGATDVAWRTDLPQPVESAEVLAEGRARVHVSKFDIALTELLGRLTYGFLGRTLDILLPAPESEFWNPRIVRDLGFVTADRVDKRFFHYLEILRHVDEAAWDKRAIWARANVDVRRDFVSAVTTAGESGGSIAVLSAQAEVRPFYDRMSALEDAIVSFERLLQQHGEEDERVFHDFLKNHPALIDVYGRAVSKPRFRYPAGDSPLGKEYVEPDFIMCRPGHQYLLVELERPAKRVTTKAGQPTADVTQAAFQTAVWQTYIQDHYDLIKTDFPGISGACESLIVISRATERSFGAGRRKEERMRDLRNLYKAQVLVYDDLLERARQAYAAIVALGGGTVDST
jgi:hypothetical protein